MELPGHEGHGHPDFDPELFAKLMKDVDEAKVINNLFLIPVGSPARFVMAQVDEDGSITTLGYIPFDFMLDVGIGFIQAVRNVVQENMPHDLDPSRDPNDDNDDDPPLAGGLFRVI